MDEEIHQHIFKDFSSQVLSPVQALQYESYLRTLRQVQEKRATILEKLNCPDKKDLKQVFSSSDNESLNEISFAQAKSLLYFSPVEKAKITDVSVNVVRPIPRHVGVVRPVQYPGRKICHPVPQALRRPRGSSQDINTGVSRLPLKKRPCNLTLEDEGPPSKIVKVHVGGIDHHESSGFCSFLPADVINEYLENIRPREEEIRTEDREVAEIMDEASSENKIFPFKRDFKSRHLTPDGQKEGTNFVDVKAELNFGYCQSPKEPWLPDTADSTVTAADRSNEVLTSFVQQISPMIINLSPESSGTSLAAPTHTARHLDNQIKRNYFDYDGGDDIITTEDDEAEKNKIVLDPESNHSVSGSEPEAFSRPKRSMEEVRRYVLSCERATDRNREDKWAQTEAEQFVEVLEDFLEENPDLPPHINDQIMEMLTKTRELAAKQKDGILFTAELFMGEPDDELYTAEFGRHADDDGWIEYTDQSTSRDIDNNNVIVLD